MVTLLPYEGLVQKSVLRFLEFFLVEPKSYIMISGAPEKLLGGLESVYVYFSSCMSWNTILGC